MVKSQGQGSEINDKDTQRSQKQPSFRNETGGSTVYRKSHTAISNVAQRSTIKLGQKHVLEALIPVA